MWKWRNREERVQDAPPSRLASAPRFNLRTGIRHPKALLWMPRPTSPQAERSELLLCGIAAMQVPCCTVYTCVQIRLLKIYATDRNGGAWLLVSLGRTSTSLPTYYCPMQLHLTLTEAMTQRTPKITSAWRNDERSEGRRTPKPQLLGRYAPLPTQISTYRIPA